jgi:uncharacterized membrane protein
MRRTIWLVISAVFVTFVALAGCSGPNRSQNPSSASGFNIDVQISPNALRGATAGTNEAQGGCGTVTATVFDQQGRMIDGALVFLSTTLGRFPPTATRQESVAVSGFTVRGVYTDALCAKAERGTGSVTGNVENATSTALFTVF